MAIVRALVTLHTSDNNPANYVTNSLYFDDDDDGATNWSLIAAAIRARYQAFRPQFPGIFALEGHETQLYRMSDPQPRAPVFEEEWSLVTAPTGDTLPRECACVLSFQGDKSSGVPQSRRRGRIYLGPILAARNDDGLPDSTLRNAVAGFGDSLLNASDASAWTWVVFSGVNQSAVPVTNGWVDNAWDTQRRRGEEWTSRTTFPFP